MIYDQLAAMAGYWYHFGDDDDDDDDDYIMLLQFNNLRLMERDKTVELCH